MKYKDNALSDKGDWFQICINSLNISTYDLEEDLPSSSHRAQVAEYQTLNIKLTEFQQKFKSQTQSVLLVKVRTLNVKERNVK